MGVFMNDDARRITGAVLATMKKGGDNLAIYESVVAALAATPEPKGYWSDGGKVWEGQPAAPAVPVRLEAWIRENFAGHGRALRRETDAPLDGEPWMSMDEAKELTRQAVALFGRAATPPVSDAVSVPREIIERFARHYDLNDCNECVPSDALEIPIYDLRDLLASKSATPAVGGDAGERLDVIASWLMGEAFCADWHDDPDMGVRECMRIKALFIDRINEFVCDEIKRAQPASTLRGGELLDAAQKVVMRYPYVTEKEALEIAKAVLALDQPASPEQPDPVTRREETITKCLKIIGIHEFSARQGVRSAMGPKVRQQALAAEAALQAVAKDIRALSTAPAKSSSGDKETKA